MRVCEFCGIEFEAKRKRRCCTRSCSTKLAITKRGRSPWDEPEIEFLSDRLGSIPCAQLIKSFKRFAAKQGYAKRTDGAITTEIGRLAEIGLTRKCIYDNFTVYELARSIGISPDRIRVFIRNGQLPSKMVSHSQRAIKRKDAIALVLQYPERFAMVERDRLFWLLEDRKLVDQVLSYEPSTAGAAKPVRCLAASGTWKYYPSLQAAGKANYLHKNSITEAIARNGRSAGMRWEYVTSPYHQTAQR